MKGLAHPNVLRLLEMIETATTIAIVYEYAPGGVLFDLIARNGRLFEDRAKQLFTQLVSGVGYLHKEGVVHRDLKLEHLLLDDDGNIIISGFGFANTFDVDEFLTEEEEARLSDPEFVKVRGLDKVKPNGTRKGDILATSDGSPTYAAPELVVRNGLYAGRKADVWSCGVILVSFHIAFCF
jgi:protein-serine/threonine kinase